MENEAAALEEVARALSPTVEVSRLMLGVSSLRSSHLGFTGAPSRVAALIVERAVRLFVGFASPEPL